jgi:hypothetical protein
LEGYFARRAAIGAETIAVAHRASAFTAPTGLALGALQLQSRNGDFNFRFRIATREPLDFHFAV